MWNADMTLDWFRLPDYSEKAMAEFEKRLGRSRQHNRAQYLRIKAVSLVELREQKADEIAAMLLRRIIVEHGEVWYEVNFAHEKLGAIYERMARFEDAESEYRWVLNSYKKTRSGSSSACELALAELILRTNQSAKYAEAADLLTQTAVSRATFFTSGWFRYWLAAARLAERLRRYRDAADFAEKALELAAVSRPQFSRHPNVGAVVLDQATKEELEQLIQLRD